MGILWGWGLILHPAAGEPSMWETVLLLAMFFISLLADANILTGTWLVYVYLLLKSRKGDGLLCAFC